VVVSFIDGGNRRKPPTCHKSLTNFNTQCCIKCTSPWANSAVISLRILCTTNAIRLGQTNDYNIGICCYSTKQ